MTIRETEYIIDDGHYGTGLTFCNEGCHKDGKTLWSEFHGYDRSALTVPEIARLYAVALLHDKEHPDHDIRVIVMGRK